MNHYYDVINGPSILAPIPMTFSDLQSCLPMQAFSNATSLQLCSNMSPDTERRAVTLQNPANLLAPLITAYYSLHYRWQIRATQRLIAC